MKELKFRAWDISQFRNMNAHHYQDAICCGTCQYCGLIPFQELPDVLCLKFQTAVYMDKVCDSWERQVEYA
jgi:hypothetical protein